MAGKVEVRVAIRRRFRYRLGAKDTQEPMAGDFQLRAPFTGRRLPDAEENFTSNDRACDYAAARLRPGRSSPRFERADVAHGPGVMRLAGLARGAKNSPHSPRGS